MSEFKPLIDEGWVIISPYGTVWHHGCFDTEKAAKKYLDNFWRIDKENIKRFSIVPGKATFEAIPITADTMTEDRGNE